MKICWSREAQNNLLQIIDYISQDSPARANAFARKIIASVNRLKAFPRMGRHVPELASEPVQPREMIVGNYRVIYQISTHTIEIVTVFHGTKQLKFYY